MEGGGLIRINILIVRTHFMARGYVLKLTFLRPVPVMLLQSATERLSRIIVLEFLDNGTYPGILFSLWREQFPKIVSKLNALQVEIGLMTHPC